MKKLWWESIIVNYFIANIWLNIICYVLKVGSKNSLNFTPTALFIAESIQMGQAHNKMQLRDFNFGE